MTEVFYVAVKGSLHAGDSSVFGIKSEEYSALCRRFPDSNKQVINGVLIKGSPLEVINSLAELGYRVTCSSGETEIVWTLRREALPGEKLVSPITSPQATPVAVGRPFVVQPAMTRAPVKTVERIGTKPEDWQELNSIQVPDKITTRHISSLERIDPGQKIILKTNLSSEFNPLSKRPGPTSYDDCLSDSCLTIPRRSLSLPPLSPRKHQSCGKARKKLKQRKSESKLPCSLMTLKSRNTHSTTGSQSSVSPSGLSHTSPMGQLGCHTRISENDNVARESMTIYLEDIVSSDILDFDKGSRAKTTDIYSCLFMRNPTYRENVATGKPVLRNDSIMFHERLYTGLEKKPVCDSKPLNEYPLKCLDDSPQMLGSSGRYSSSKLVNNNSRPPSSELVKSNSRPPSLEPMNNNSRPPSLEPVKKNSRPPSLEAVKTSGSCKSLSPSAISRLPSSDPVSTSSNLSKPRKSVQTSPLNYMTSCRLYPNKTLPRDAEIRQTVSFNSEKLYTTQEKGLSNQYESSTVSVPESESYAVLPKIEESHSEAITNDSVPEVVVNSTAKQKDDSDAYTSRRSTAELVRQNDLVNDVVIYSEVTYPDDTLSETSGKFSLTTSVVNSEISSNRNTYSSETCPHGFVLSDLPYIENVYQVVDNSTYGPRRHNESSIISSATYYADDQTDADNSEVPTVPNDSQRRPCFRCQPAGYEERRTELISNERRQSSLKKGCPRSRSPKRNSRSLRSTRQSCSSAPGDFGLVNDSVIHNTRHPSPCSQKSGSKPPEPDKQSELIRLSARDEGGSSQSNWAVLLLMKENNELGKVEDLDAADLSRVTNLVEEIFNSKSKRKLYPL